MLPLSQSAKFATNAECRRNTNTCVSALFSIAAPLPQDTKYVCVVIGFHSPLQETDVHVLSAVFMPLSIPYLLFNKYWGKYGNQLVFLHRNVALAKILAECAKHG